MLKRVLALTLAVILCIGVLVGCNSEDTPTATTTAPTQGGANISGNTTTAPADDGPLFDETFKLDMLIVGAKTNPWNDEWYLVKKIEERCNVDFDVTEIYSGFDDAYQMRISDGDIPDITWLNSNKFGNEYGPQGAYINILDYLDKMPNVAAMLEKYPDAKAMFLSTDGELYHLPTPVTGTSTVYGYVYREDIFNKHNLTFPTTQEGFYNVLKTLKQEYPDSYPLVLRQWSGNMQGLQNWAPSWGTDFPLPPLNNAYFSYDYDAKSWFWGGASDEMKELVTFMNKLLDEGLLHPSYITIDNNGWLEAINSGKSFITFDTVSYAQSMTTNGQKTNPEFKMSAAAPIGFGSNGTATTFAPSVGSYSFLISSKCKDLDSVLKYMNWLYSEEAIMLSNWGVEGETFQYDANGKKGWTEAAWAEHDTKIQTNLGLNYRALYAVSDYEAQVARMAPETVQYLSVADAYRTTKQQPVLSYTKDEQRIIDTIAVDAFAYTKQEISKFLMGERDLSEWDKFVSELEARGISQVKAVHEAAYARKYG